MTNKSGTQRTKMGFPGLIRIAVGVMGIGGFSVGGSPVLARIGVPITRPVDELFVPLDRSIHNQNIPVPRPEEARSVSQRLTERTASIVQRYPNLLPMVEALKVPRFSPEDRSRWKSAFNDNAQGRFSRASKTVSRTRDQSLKGDWTVVRLMHPTLYRSKASELADWLKTNASHPQVHRVYRLARRRGALASTTRPAISWKEIPLCPDHAQFAIKTPPIKNPGIKVPSTALERRVRRLTSQGRVTVALGEVQHQEHQISDRLKTRLYGLIVRGYYHYGKDEKAVTLAREVQQAPVGVLSNWWGGLSAWRLGDQDTAQQLFSQLALSPDHEVLRGRAGSEQSAAAYWGARAALIRGDGQTAIELLRVAAQEPATFYGMLARTTVGAWPQATPAGPSGPLGPEISLDCWRRFVSSPPVDRALRLFEIHQDAQSARRLRALVDSGAPPEIVRGLYYLGLLLDLPSVTMKAAFLLADQGQTFEAGLYPMATQGVWSDLRVQRPLIWGLVRQESRFISTARSQQRAIGLMQLLPSTAAFMAQQQSRPSLAELSDPAWNLELGQRYIEHLLDLPHIDGNLLYFLVAYNAGPGNLAKWRATLNDNHGNSNTDPLLFIESVRSRETRDFVEKVMANIWIYRRLQQEEPVWRNALMAGVWPIHRPSRTESLAEHDLTGDGARASTP